MCCRIKLQRTADVDRCLKCFFFNSVLVANVCCITGHRKHVDTLHEVSAVFLHRSEDRGARMAALRTQFRCVHSLYVADSALRRLHCASSAHPRARDNITG